MTEFRSAGQLSLRHERHAYSEQAGIELVGATDGGALCLMPVVIFQTSLRLCETNQLKSVPQTRNALCLSRNASIPAPKCNLTWIPGTRPVPHDFGRDHAPACGVAPVPPHLRTPPGKHRTAR